MTRHLQGAARPPTEPKPRAAERAPAAACVVLTLAPPTLVTCGVSAVLAADRRFAELGPTASLATAAAWAAGRQRVDVLLVDHDHVAVRDHPSLAHLRTAAAAQLVLLTETVGNAVLTSAVATGAVGIVAKQSSGQQFRAALESAARGKLTYPSPLADSVVLRDGSPKLKRKAHQPLLDRLTPREREVLELLVRGRTIKQCAQLLGRSVSTIDNHKSRIMKKLNIHRSVDLVLLALEQGLL